MKELMDQEIGTYRKQIDTLQSEFAKMLNDTLGKIKTKIEAANRAWENENETKMLKGYEDIA